MTTIKTASNATSTMKSVLPRSITPLDIARRAECSVMSVMRPDLMVGDSVFEIANLADASKVFTQADETNQAELVLAAAFGRETLNFDADRERHYTLSESVDYTGPFSLLSVFRPETLGGLMNLIGDEDTNETNRVGLRLQTNSRMRARVGSGTAQSGILTAGNWYAAIMSYDGSANVTLEVLGEAAVTGSVVNEATGTNLRLGDNNAAFGFIGQIDMAAMFTTNLHNSANTGLLADVKFMVKNFYKNVI